MIKSLCARLSGYIQFKSEKILFKEKNTLYYVRAFYYNICKYNIKHGSSLYRKLAKCAWVGLDPMSRHNERKSTSEIVSGPIAFYIVGTQLFLIIKYISWPYMIMENVYSAKINNQYYPVNYG